MAFVPRILLMQFTERDDVFLSTGSTLFTLACGVILLCPVFEKNGDLSH